MKSAKGRYISKADLKTSLLLLRDRLSELSELAMGDVSTPGQSRDAVFKSVLLIRNVFNAIDGFQDAVKPLDVLIKATVDLDRGHLPPLFTPRRLKGAPKDTFAADTLKVYALVAVALYVRAGLKVGCAIKRVVSEYSRAGVKIATASTIKNWRSLLTDKQPSEGWVIINERVNGLLAKCSAIQNEKTVQAFVRATATQLAR